MPRLPPTRISAVFVEGTFTTPEVVDRILGEVKGPVLSGLTIGHTDDQLTLPLGVMATLDAGLGTLDHRRGRDRRMTFSSRLDWAARPNPLSELLAEKRRLDSPVSI